MSMPDTGLGVGCEEQCAAAGLHVLEIEAAGRIRSLLASKAGRVGLISGVVWSVCRGLSGCMRCSRGHCCRWAESRAFHLWSGSGKKLHSVESVRQASVELWKDCRRRSLSFAATNLVNVGAPFGVYKREFSPAAMPRPSLHYC
jgi:hypothetical protein